MPASWGGERAFYSTGVDHIQLPERESFHGAAALYATWGHEAIHSTGHESRLKRDLSGAFGSSRYAREELVADLCGKKEPADGLSAKFSRYHGSALGLIFGRAGEAEFSDLEATREDAAALRCKVQAGVNPGVAEDAVTLTTMRANGRTLHVNVDHAIGSFEPTMSDEMRDGKFHALVDSALGSARAASLIRVALCPVDPCYRLDVELWR